MPNIGATELLIVLAIVMLLFGSARLPKLARSLGEARRELQAAEREPRTDDEPVTAGADNDATRRRRRS